MFGFGHFWCSRTFKKSGSETFEFGLRNFKCNSSKFTELIDCAGLSTRNGKVQICLLITKELCILMITRNRF